MVHVYAIVSSSSSRIQGGVVYQVFATEELAKTHLNDSCYKIAGIEVEVKKFLVWEW